MVRSWLSVQISAAPMGGSRGVAAISDLYAALAREREVARSPLPLLADARVLQDISADDHGVDSRTTLLASARSMDDVLQFYRTELRRMGFEPVTRGSLSRIRKGGALLLGRGGEQVSIAVARNLDVTLVAWFTFIPESRKAAHVFHAQGFNALGFVAYFLVVRYLDQEADRLRQAAEATRGEYVPVVVASRVLSAGNRIDASTMSLGRMPSRHMSPRAVGPAEFDQFEQRVLNRPMSAGEPLLRDFVAGAVVHRFSELLPVGTRAVSVRVSALESHSGLLLPGDYIDLFAQVPRAEQGRDAQLLGLFERVKVLAAGRQPLRSQDEDFQPLGDHSRNYDFVTLALPAADAEDLLRAREAGEIVYLLRGPQDHRARFVEAGIPMFADHAPATDAEPAAPSLPSGGYAYYSNRVPRGGARGQASLLDSQVRDSSPAEETGFDAPEPSERALLELIRRPVLPAAPTDSADELGRLAHVLH